MRINELEIRNFRAIAQAELSTAADIVIVAGPNGCGKSCVFDAIRFLKSLYGGYTQAYEWHQFFGELGIDPNRPDSFSSLLRSRDKELVLRAEFRLDETEKDYLRVEIDSLAERLAWDILAPDEQGFARRRPYLLAKNQEAERQEIAEKKTEVREELERLLAKTNLLAQFRIDRSGKLELIDNFALLILFSLYVPQKLGVIDYHGAYRQYNREQVG